MWEQLHCFIYVTVLLKLSSILQSLGLFFWSSDHSSVLCHWVLRVFFTRACVSDVCCSITTLWGWDWIYCAFWAVVKDHAGLSLERHRQSSWDIGDVCPAEPLVWLELEPLSGIVNAGVMHNKQFAVLMRKMKPISWLYQKNRAFIFQVKSCHKWNFLGWRKKHQSSVLLVS